MPRAKGKVNYKADLLIQVVEEKLPAGAIGWQEVAALYQFRSGELALRDHEDVKRHWVEKCCNKYKKPTGTPGDPKRDMILRCQRIHQKILNRNAAAVMGADSGGDDGLDVSSESDEEESEEEEVGGNETGGEMEEQAEYRAGSRVPTPIEEIAADEGSGVCVVDAADVQLLLGGGELTVWSRCLHLYNNLQHNNLQPSFFSLLLLYSNHSNRFNLGSNLFRRISSLLL
jgi:hypothetical protein